LHALNNSSKLTKIRIMKQCPKCNAEVDDSYDLCWNCQYSFSENKVLDNSDFDIVCPKCNTKVGPHEFYCPNCFFNLNQLEKKEGMNGNKSANFSCLRCNVMLDYKGIFEFHEGPHVGALGSFFELLENKESFALYVCPHCGKVEFFMPGYPASQAAGQEGLPPQP
jgi:hypothetical protein